MLDTMLLLPIAALTPAGVNTAQFPFLLLALGCLGAGAFLARHLSLPAADRGPTYTRLLLIGTLLTGAALRLWNVDFGLPAAFHPDEHQKANLLARMVDRGTIDPGLSLHPPLLLYFTWCVSKVVSLFPVPYRGIALYLLSGRLVNVIAGTASIWLVYDIARSVAARRAALLAAMLVAVSPLHVTNSRYMKEDVLFLFFALACAAVVLRAVRSEKPRLLFAAALLAGLSMGSKYTGLASIVFVLAAPWLRSTRFVFTPDWRYLRWALLSLPFAVAGFALGVPHTLTDAEAARVVIDGFSAESKHAMRGHLGLVIDPWSQLWTYHLRRSVLPGLTPLPAIAGLLGLGMLLGWRRTDGLFVAGAFFLFYLPAEFANSKPPPQPDRYILPCMPFLCIACAVFAASAVERLRRGNAAWLLVSALLVFLPLRETYFYAKELRPDTRERMRAWLEEWVPPGKKIVLVGHGSYLPRIDPRYKGVPLRDVMKDAGPDFASQMKASPYDYLLFTEPTPDRFRVENIKRSEEMEHFRSALLQLHEVSRMEARRGIYGFHNPVLTLYDLKQ